MAKRHPFLLLILLLLAVPAVAQTDDGGQSSDRAAPAPQGPAVPGVVSGSVTNRTPGGVVPDSGELMLHIWDAAFQEKGMENNSTGRIDETDYSRRRSLLFARAQQLLPEGQ